MLPGLLNELLLQPPLLFRRVVVATATAAAVDRAEAGAADWAAREVAGAPAEEAGLATAE
jgi:hypothetical protein